MDALDDVMARLQAMADDVPVTDPVPTPQARTPLIESPRYLNDATATAAYLAELPQHPQSQRCTQECVSALLETLNIPAEPWQQEWLYRLLCVHPGPQA